MQAMGVLIREAMDIILEKGKEEVCVFHKIVKVQYEYVSMTVLYSYTCASRD